MRTWLFGKENNISRNFIESHEIPDKAVAIPLVTAGKEEMLDFNRGFQAATSEA